MSCVRELLEQGLPVIFDQFDINKVGDEHNIVQAGEQSEKILPRSSLISNVI